ncbi:MAG: hypothetical protein AAF913_18765, partial [Pseudomonadota bacterium]
MRDAACAEAWRQTVERRIVTQVTGPPMRLSVLCTRCRAASGTLLLDPSFADGEHNVAVRLLIEGCGSKQRHWHRNCREPARWRIVDLLSAPRVTSRPGGWFSRVDGGLGCPGWP